MARGLPYLFAVLVVVGAWFVPEASPARLSSLQAYELLTLPVGPEPEAGAEDDRRPLWEAVVNSPAARITDEGQLEIVLHGVRHLADATSLPEPIVDTGVARRSIVRGLRQYISEQAADPDVLAQHPEYADVVITGDVLPQTDWGANFDVQLFAANPPLDEAGAPVEGPEFSVQSVEFSVGDDFEPIVVHRFWRAPDRDSIVPPVVAVLLAILFRRPVLALFVAVFSGAVLLRYRVGEALATSLAGGLADVGREYFWTELVDTERLYIIGFVLFMLAMVGVMTRSGGIRGLMDAVARLAGDAKRTQIATWLMGLVIFFDDYANTILVGSTMRPLTDRFRIAREKLAYIVDSTAAPVAGLSVFSTWIAFEVSTFNGQLPAAGMRVDQGYEVFLRTIPYSFYCFLTLFFVGLVAFSNRDFGPMLTAERRARSTGDLLRKGAKPMVSEKATSMEAAAGVTPDAWRAILPLIAFLAGTMFEILRGGGAFSMEAARFLTIEGATQVLYDGSGSWPLLVGSLLGFGVATLGALLAGLRGDILSAAWRTVSAMAIGFAILYLAWMIGAVCSDLGTAPFLTALAADLLDPKLLPMLLFLLAGAVAFSTGSSWSTMSILLPLTVGLAYQLGHNAALAPTVEASGQHLMVVSIGAVLSGAIFGDHCSPISDTTVMSSIASASDHIDHVRTQVPYALTSMAVSVVCGYFPATYYGLSPWVGLVLGCGLLTLIVFAFGKRVDGAAPTRT